MGVLCWAGPCTRKPGPQKTPALMRTRASLCSRIAAWPARLSLTLSVPQLTPGGKAAQAGVGVGDWVLYIDGESTSSMTHIEAQNRIRACGDRLCLTLSRPENHRGKPQKDSLPCSEPLKYNFAPSTALNKTARPFGAGSPPNPRPGLVTKPVTYVPLAPTCTPQHNGYVAVPSPSPQAELLAEPWISPRSHPATGTALAQPLLCHLGRVLYGHLAAKQAVPNQGVLT
ncbi:PREDICTED: PDZ and LIM domain protein 7-like, partial [Cariama cristata]|uniref:PDZ and LIM domain protein 7-like n=1 Tax=Cariama cristata TaxID=54380 RepID=UPI0005201ACE